MGKIPVKAQKCNYGEIVHKKSHLKVPVGLKSQQTLADWQFFFFFCPLKGGYFSSVDLEMGVCIHIQEVSTYGR